MFLGYASRKGHAFLDRELYLPQEWAADRARRAEASVPEAVEFATKPALAQQMLARAFAAGIPAAWVTVDEISGDDSSLRRWLRCFNCHSTFALRLLNVRISSSQGDALHRIVSSGSLRRMHISQRVCPPSTEYPCMRRVDRSKAPRAVAL